MAGFGRCRSVTRSAPSSVPGEVHVRRRPSSTASVFSLINIKPDIVTESFTYSELAHSCCRSHFINNLGASEGGRSAGSTSSRSRGPLLRERHVSGSLVAAAPQPHGHTRGRGRGKAGRAAASCAHASLAEDTFPWFSKRRHVIPSVTRQLWEEKSKHIRSISSALPIAGLRSCEVENVRFSAA